MGWTTGVRFQVGLQIFHLYHCIQTGSAAHLASYPMGTGGSSLVVNPGTWSWLSSI